MSELEERNLLVLHEEPSSGEYGHNPYARPVEDLLDYGIILADKQPGPSSHEVVAWIRRILTIRKAGHSGTLDPPVSGLLPVGIGEATKVLSALLLGPKEYVAVARLHDPVDDRTLNEVLKEFAGEIFQKPPQRSAVKRVQRSRTIYEIELTERIGRLLLLRVSCEAGTYIRKLVYDIGEVLGPGATMVELRRTRVHHFTEDRGMVTLHEVYQAYNDWKASGSEDPLRKVILPVEEAVKPFKPVYVRDSAVEAICQGAQLAVPGILRLSPDIVKNDLVCLYTGKGELVALARASMSSDEIREAVRGIAFTTERVIMKAGTYPRMWKTQQAKGAGVA